MLRFALAIALAAGVALANPVSASAASEEIKIKARYRLPPCSPPERPVMEPLPHAKLAVKFGGRTVKTRLDAGGEARVKLRGRGGQARAKTILDGQLLEVTPFNKSAPYTYTDDLKLGKKKTFELEIQQLEDAGAASAWTILDGGAELAQRTAPSGVQLDKVTAKYDSDRGRPDADPDLPFSQTGYDSSTRTIEIDSGRARADEFEQLVLLHEYGHHLLRQVASPGPNASGVHQFEHSYPGQPAMPWSEGFANAFAAFALNGPLHGLRCRSPFINLASTPATPQSLDGPRYNQYHEISVAATLWALAQRLGGPEAGLKALLGALNGFNAAYGGPESLREARDALIHAGLEDTPEEHQALTDLFARQRIGWGLNLFVAIPFGEGGRFFAHQNQHLQVRAAGPSPYGTCEDTGFTSEAPPGTPLGGSRGASGNLAYTWHDECYQSGFQSGADQAIQIPYPSPLDLGDPEGKFTVSVRWYCEPVEPPDPDAEPCTQQTGYLRVHHGAFASLGPEGMSDCPHHADFFTADYCWDAAGTEHETNYPLAYDAWTPILEFDALGRCKSLVDGFDCGR